MIFGENIEGVLCGILDIVALQNDMKHRCKVLYAYTANMVSDDITNMQCIQPLIV